MSMQDPIADMFTRIRNVQMMGRLTVEMPLSKLKLKIAELLKNEGYIQDFGILEAEKPTMVITLKYDQGVPVIEKIQRVSRPGLRVYVGVEELPQVKNGLGIAIISTPKGIMSDRYARKAKLGGEVLGYVS